MSFSLDVFIFTWKTVVFENFLICFLTSRNPCYSGMLVSCFSSTRLGRDIKMFENKPEHLKITRQKVLIDVQIFQKVLRCWGPFSASLENSYWSRKSLPAMV